ncbi:MAG TPA: quinone-dependent dihydroorotate dehydrogenase [Chitinophagaceae bacterium]|nr:quinone-dependent dihydroorotate dehydrogenase [Chitinophagaceae bacterium]
MYRLLQKILFLFPPESMHRLAMGWLKLICSLPNGKKALSRMYLVRSPALRQEVFGLQFSNPVGLAAGFDKNALYLDALACLGFGFVEIGTVTPLPQPGNEPPRLFRLPKDGALINRMGFNNDGAPAIARRLARRPAGLIIGGNIGKNRSTPNAQAAADYISCFNTLFDVVDYFVVNVSSPNTPGLRELQQKAILHDLLSQLQGVNLQHPSPKPILLKISPDLDSGQLDDILDIVLQTKLAGIVATNTSLDRSHLLTRQPTLDLLGAGGLSGKPIRQKSLEILRYLGSRSQQRFILVASGGIFSAADALEMLEAGATLVQVYTGFIYEGPGIVRRICRELPPAD